MALTEYQNGRYAIEMSLPLVEAMDKSINVVGTDFREQTLFDKKVDVCFANPPYLQFEQWAEKMILEANAALLYLILPTRWENSVSIKNALTVRQAEAVVIGNFDYLEADRVARAKVNIIRIELGCLCKGGVSGSDRDPFGIWFDVQFPLNAPGTEASEWATKKAQEEELNNAISGGGEIVKREGLVRLLDKRYQQDLQMLMKTYQAISDIPFSLLSELGVNVKSAKASLKLKVKSLKDVYWKQLFDNLDAITNKLCHKTRAELLNKLLSRTNVDFSEANAVAIVIWVIKQSNDYFEDQIIYTYEKLTEQANVQAYKSNEKTIKFDRWRYGDERYSSLGPYGLDYRVILENVGGYCCPSNYSESSRCGLKDSAAILLGDLITLANNVGFDAVGNVLPVEKHWKPGKKEYFFFMDANGEKQVLFEAKAFKNNNLHIRMHETFIQKLNIVHGRLKGWLRSAADATAEMGVPLKVAEEAFGVQLKLCVKDVPLLAFKG